MMLTNYLDQLNHSIQWAQQDSDIVILALARKRMEQLILWISYLQEDEQKEAYAKVDALLPMEWPLWMEACRYGDNAVAASGLH